MEWRARHELPMWRELASMTTCYLLTVISSSYPLMSAFYTRATFRATATSAHFSSSVDRAYYGGYGFGGGFGGYDFGGGFGDYFDDDGLNRGDWAEKSGAASRREEQARSAFKDLHSKTMAEMPAAATTYELLKPSTHLTQPCWRDVKKYIVSHPGWSAKRRQATDAEKRQHGETRQSAVHFVDVTFTPPKAAKGATSAAKKTAEIDKVAKEEARAQMSSSMSSWVRSAKRPAETASEEETDMAPKRKKALTEEEEEEEENDAPPSGQLKTKRWSVQLKRLEGSMGLGIDEQYYVTAVKAGGAAAAEGSIAIGDHILEINGVETGTLSEPIAKVLPTNPDAPVKVRLARYSAQISAEEGVRMPRAAATKGAATKGAPTKGFEIRYSKGYSRSSRVVEWDDATFVDCRPSEAQDAMEETEAAATGLDVADASMREMAQQALPRALVARLPQGSFASAEEANSAAMAFMEMVLAHERTGDGGRSLSAPRDDVDAEWSTGFKVPKTSAAPELLTTVDSCGTYGAKVTLFCDVHGADVHNVVVATLKASVVPA